MSENVATEIISFYAAIVSTATAAWAIYKDWNDVGKLRVTVGFRLLAGNGMIEENLLVWNITNVGRRSVLLTHAAGDVQPTPKSDDGFTSFIVNDPQLPKRLEPGDYHMSICREFDFLNDIKKLYASDSVGRSFEAPKQDVLLVNKKLRDLAAKGITRASIRP